MVGIPSDGFRRLVGIGRSAQHQAKMFPRALDVAPLSMLICITVLCVGQEFSDMPSVEPSALRLRDPHFDGCRSCTAAAHRLAGATA